MNDPSDGLPPTSADDAIAQARAATILAEALAESDRQRLRLRRGVRVASAGGQIMLVIGFVILAAGMVGGIVALLRLFGSVGR